MKLNLRWEYFICLLSSGSSKRFWIKSHPILYIWKLFKRNVLLWLRSFVCYFPFNPKMKNFIHFFTLKYQIFQTQYLVRIGCRFYVNISHQNVELSWMYITLCPRIPQHTKKWNKSKRTKPALDCSLSTSRKIFIKENKKKFLANPTGLFRKSSDIWIEIF